MIMVVYLGGSALVCAEQRQFYVIVPVILLWTAYLLQHTIHTRIQFNKDQAIEG